MAAGSTPPLDVAGAAAPSLDQLARADRRQAFANAVKLGLALLATWGIALVVRLLLPRRLGPGAFGTLTSADAFAASGMVLLSFGVDTYISKEVAVRPRHASDFFGGLLLLRLLAGVPVLCGVLLVLAQAGRPPATQRLVFLFGCAYLAAILGNTHAALLRAHGTVGGLSLINVVTKLAWAGLVGAALFWRAPLEALALALLASEGLKAWALFRLARRALDLRVRLDLPAVRAVLIASLPFYATGIVHGLTGRLDIAVLTLLVDDAREIGWYGSAATLALLSTLLIPLVGWVVLPLMARAHHRSREELMALVRRSLVGLEMVTLPLSLFIGLGADVWVRLAFGAAFAPAAASLRTLAPVFMFTYVAVLLCQTLIVLGRAWIVTMVTLVGLVVNPLLAVLSVPLCARLLGPGGAGVGSAIGAVGMEIVTVALLLRAVGGEVFDRPGLIVVARTLLACAAVTALYVALAPLGPWRLLACAAAYLALATGLGALDLRQLPALLRVLREARSEK